MSSEDSDREQGDSGAVRLATRSDVDALVRLNEFVQDLHAGLYPAQFKRHADDAGVRKFFSELVEADKNSIGVFGNLGRVVAYIWIEEIERPSSSFMQASSRLHVHHICVDPDWRGKGIGSALVDWAEKRARAAGMLEVTVDHWAANVEAHAFFSREGFEDVRIAMRRLVQGKGD